MPGVQPETEKKRKALKKDLYKVLAESPGGIIKEYVWPRLSASSELKLTNSEFRVGSMDDIFLLFRDMVHSENRDGRIYICLNQHVSPAGSKPLQQNAGKYVAPGNRHNNLRKPVQAPVLLPLNPFSMPAPLTQAVNKKSNKLDEGGWPVLGTPVPPKTRKQQETKSTNESSHKLGHSYHVNAQSSQGLSHPHSVNKNKHSHVECDDGDDDDYDTESIGTASDYQSSENDYSTDRRSSQHSDTATPVQLHRSSQHSDTATPVQLHRSSQHSDTATPDLLHRSNQNGDTTKPFQSLSNPTSPLDAKKFQDKEMNIKPFRLTANSIGKQLTKQLETCAQECIELLAESNNYVSQERIQMLLLQRCNIPSLQVVGHRRIEELSCVKEHNRAIARVNAYVQAFFKERSICTLHELKYCLRECDPAKTDFNNLNLGPMQRLPIIYEYFKFPTDMEDIPAITTVDILEHLRNYLTRNSKWSEKVDLTQFMEYLVPQYEADNAYQLGIRISSVALAIQVLKMAGRHASENRRNVIEAFKGHLHDDIEKAFQKFRMTVIHTASDGSWEVRNRYMTLQPEVAIQEIFEKFKFIMLMEEPSGRSQIKMHHKIESSILNFLQILRTDDNASALFHLAICVSHSVLQEAAMKRLLPKEEDEKTEQDKEERVKPPKGDVINLLKNYLKRCLQRGALNLLLLDQIEQKIAEECKFPSFVEIGYGRFLHFILQETKELLEEYGGTSLGSGSGSSDSESGFKPCNGDILSFIHQCIQCGKDSEEDIDAALCNQFNVKETKHLGYGKITNLMTASKKPGQHQYQEHSLVFEVAMGTDVRIKTESKIGMLGHQTKEAALVCLHNCPLLEDMEIWSHWSLVFEPELGKLKDFIQKYGGTYTIPVDGGKKSFTYHIIAMETSPGVLLKLTSQTSTELFEEALMQKNPRNVCGQLMSLIVANKGMRNIPMALITNQMKSQLIKMHAADTNDNLPGAPPSDTLTDEAVQFVLRCLAILPVKTCVSLANQIFLEPLGQVVGSSKSKFLLLSACQRAEDTNRLQELGCMLGVGEWTSQIQQKCQIKMTDVEIVPEEEAEMIVLDNNDEEEDDEEFETASVSSDLSDILLEGDIEEENDRSTDKTSLTSVEVSECITETTTPKTKEKEDSADEISDLNDMEIKSDEEIQSELLIDPCEKVVNTIRREEFGIGIELNEDGQKLKIVQDKRLGRSLDRLSKDLYSKDTHFVLELIQNADDNDYPESLAKKGQMASVKFVMQTDGVTVLNNESGFLEKNIRALCDVGRSTKGKHKFGYIGQKGIGFKSVFRVTDRPEVHSNGYHICFDVLSGPMGYILPHWIDDELDAYESWTTKIVLPLKEEMKATVRTLAGKFNDIHPSLLLFLHRLREITIDNKVENSSQVMRRKDLGNDVIEIEHNTGIDRWLVVKKMLDASKISLQAKSGVEVESTEISLAFPLTDQCILSKVMPPKQPVFAFLPLRSYGFRFIIQADFDVPSSREDVDCDSAWNQWIRNEIHKLFLEALDVFKNHKEFTGMKALINFLQFVPVEGEILDFFRPVSTQILKQLRAKPCLPTQPYNGGEVLWKLPTQVVTVKDSLVHEVVTPEFLQKHLDLFYLHREVADMLNPTLIQCLGIESLTVNHLIQIGKAITMSPINEDDFCTSIYVIAKWLACVYRSLDEFHDNQEIYIELKKMKIIPLASQVFVSLEDNTIFFPLSLEDMARSQKYRDPISYLQEDMKTIHPLFLAAPDNEVNSQVQKMLVKLDVCQLTPNEVINHHILPVLKSEMWKNKNRETLISYLVYIKEQTEKNSSLVNMDELANVAIVMTNQGEKYPKKDNVHFTPIYGNKYNLMQIFPGYDWCLLDSVYIRDQSSSTEKQKWHKFFCRLGITDLITVRPVQVELDSESVKESAWSSIEQLYPDDFKQGCVVEDNSCDEIRDLLKSNKCPQSYKLQMKSLCEYLDQVWDTQFARYTKTKLIRKDNKQERDVESSFCIWLKTCDWLPTIEVKVGVENNGAIKYTEEVCCKKPSTLYYPFEKIVKLLHYTVNYVSGPFDTNKSTFAQFLGLKFEVSLEDLISSLKKWGQRSDGGIPALFATSQSHIEHLYSYLGENLNKKQIQDLLDKAPVIFVPVITKSVGRGDMNQQRFAVNVAGQMLSRQEVWWEDKTELFQKHQDILTEIHADIGRKKILSRYINYSRSPSLREFFMMGKIQTCPDVEEYSELLVHVASSQSRVETETLHDVMKLLSMIGDLMYVDENDPESVTKKMLNEIQRKKMLNRFKGQNIIPTKRKTWTSLEKNPLIADNNEYENIFKNEDNVHFVLMEENEHRRGQHNVRASARESYHINPEAMMSVLRMCEIENLSDVVEEQIIPSGYKLSPRLQNYMIKCVPLLQVFLFNNYGNIYQSLIDEGLVDTLSRLNCIETDKLEVKYWFKNDPDIFRLKEEICKLNKEEFFFQKRYEESYNFADINKAIAKIFSNNDRACFNDLRDLLTDIHSCIFEKTTESLEDCLSRHSASTDIDAAEVVWTVPPSMLPDIEPVVEEEEDDVEEEEITASTNEPAIMRAWPPMSDGKNHPKAKSTVDRDEQAESKVWPPPRAPDYMKTVKDLPSGVRVVRESQEGDQRTSQNTTDKLPVADVIKSGEEEHPSEDQHQERPKETFDEDKSVPPKSVSDGIPAVAQHDDRPPSSNQHDRPPSSNHADRPLSSQHDDRPTIIHHDGKPHLNHHEQHDNHSSATLRNKVPVDAQTGLPIWVKELEYEVEELASGKTLKLPNFTMSDEETPEMAEIGQYGEQIVYNYLLNEKGNNPNISSVKWCNEEEEIGLPYDFTVGLKTEKEEYTVYIEVKSTISDTKEIFEISYPQVKFAQDNRERFHVYRIFSSLNPDRVRLVRIQNLAQKINAKQVKLCLLI
ncbi:uncharacterized protein LOC143080482 isoform X2 [Mytilus galloprovincialis]|uniref:uncharacterized protein LOC143080482 isoform X2 n=1 Tax=Mytilus galloprovincialis TaxID=29158 RepID=UPI003F7BC863